MMAAALVEVYAYSTVPNLLASNTAPAAPMPDIAAPTALMVVLRDPDVADSASIDFESATKFEEIARLAPLA
ncbi:hypothetical protein PSPTOT1_3719 [Pseudomonas syringae pv. tomato T1]|nr:hypothetical protein PSPTOT1_3719 [Pseudomonas syringae pv. tomato T1]